MTVKRSSISTPFQMTKVHLFADDHWVDALLEWLAQECAISAREITSYIESAHPGGEQHVARRSGIPCVRIENIRDVVASEDIIIVAGDDIDGKLAALFELGLHNVYNGNEMARRSSAAGRFLAGAADLFVGPIPPVTRDPGASDALRFCRDGIRAKEVPRHKLFIVNSLPKSGTLWMAGMLARILGVQPREQIIISHVADIEVDWPKFNNHGAVVLVRDMRDVVVSWFHDAARTDLRTGFSEPRYRCINEFYWEFFLGTLLFSDRYYNGDLCYWVNKNCANFVPLIRYEDMRADPLSSVAKVLNAWRVDYDPAEAKQVCQEFSFDRVAAASHAGDDYLSSMFRAGHLRRGKVGGWKSELPPEIAADIERRFAAYQERLGYAPDPT